MKWLKSLLSINLDQSSQSDIYTVREGRATRVDDAFKAWTTGDLKQMLDAVSTETHPIDRHFLLQRIVRETYKLRDDSYYRDLCLSHAQLHYIEFEKIAPILKDEMRGTLPRVTTFQQLSTVLVELGMHDCAIQVCERALEYGLRDGTKSGFEGRIRRIRAKMY